MEHPRGTGADKDDNFRREFEERVRTTIEESKMLSRDEKIVVACSGGKDSTTALYLLKKFGYNVEAMTIDLLIGKWSAQNLENIKRFCADNDIKLHVVDIRSELGYSICYIRSAVQSKTSLKNCMICGSVKRWLMNKKARDLGADKIATGHNLDDEAETVLMNLFTGNPELGLTLGPKTGAVADEKFVQRIKPLYFCLNSEIRRYSKLMGFPVLYEPCPCSSGSFRRMIRAELERMEESSRDRNAGNLKRNVVDSFLETLPAMRDAFAKGRNIRYCAVCGEPSRNEICRTCKMMGVIGR